MAETIEERITRHEGLRLSAYRDSKGLLTIGVGRCLDTHPFSPDELRVIGHDGREQPITKEQAIWLLQRDISACSRTVDNTFDWATSLTQLRHEVIIEMVFQLGLSKFLEFKKTIDFMKSGDADAASVEMLDSSWHEQTPERAEELSNLYKQG